MSIRARIWLAILALVLPMVLIVGILGRETNSINDHAAEVRDNDVPAAFLYAQILEEVNDLQENVTEYLHGEPAERELFDFNKQELEDYMAQLEPLDPEDRQFDEIKTLIGRYLDTIDEQVFGVYFPEEEEAAERAAGDVELASGDLLAAVRTSADLVLISEDPDALYQMRQHIWLEYLAGEMNTSVSEYVSGQADERVIFTTSSRGFARRLAELKRNVDDPERHEQLDQIESQYVVANAAGEEIFATFDPRDYEQALRATNLLENGLFLRLGDLLEESVIEENDEAFFQIDTLVASLTRLNRTLIAGTALAVIFGVGLAYLAARSVGQSIQAVVRVAGRLSTGEKVEKTPQKDRPPEFSHLYDALFDMVGELQHEQDRAEEANRSKSQFLANISHEIRTPLNSVLGHSQLLAGSENLDAEEGEHVQAIMRSGQLLLNLINDVLDMSSIEEGRIEVRESSVSIRQLFDAINSMLETQAAEKGATLRFTVADAVPDRIATDEAKLQQILVNLINNGIKFGGKGTVTTAAQLSGNTVAITVADQGDGVLPEMSEAIFDRFERSGETKTEGTGLGLAISREYAQALGGDLTLVDFETPGATFRLTLPAKTGRAERKRPSPRSTPSANGQKRHLGHVLIVDDHSENRTLLRSMLGKGAEMELAEVEDGESAVAHCREEMPDVIFMDIRMPGIDGLEATEQIRRLPGGSEPTVIVVSANAMSTNADEVHERGGDGFLAKPVVVDQLWGMIDDLVDISGSTESNADGPGSDAHLSEFAVVQVEYKALSDGDRERLVSAVQSLSADEIDVVVEEVQLSTDAQQMLRDAARDFRFPEILDALLPVEERAVTL